jgi:hypothetical protein
MKAEKIDPKLSQIRDTLAFASIVQLEEDLEHQSTSEMSQAWLKYIREMTPFYSDIIAHYFKSVSFHQYEFAPEDVYVFKALSELFACTTENGVVYTLGG